MRVNRILVSTLLAAAVCLPSLSQARQISVQESSIGTFVSERKPYGTASHFSSEVGRLVAFTRIVGGDTNTRVTHKWYYGNKLMAEVQLRIGADSWRTWSSKNIVSDWVGEWRVDVVAEDGTWLETIRFTVG